MKQLYTLILTLILFTLSAQAQEVLLKEDFTNASQTNLTPAVSGNWTVTGGAIYTRSLSGNEAQVTTKLNVNGNFSKLDADIRIKWAGTRSANGGGSQSFNSPIYLCYQIGSNPVQKVPVDAAITVGTAVQNRVVIPLSNNYDNVKIYFETTLNKNYSYSIDDLEIVALPNMFKWSSRPDGEQPFVVAAPGTTSPYLLNDVPMYWSMTKGAGVTVEAATVNNTQFPRSGNSFSIVQTGASATEGTNVKIKFGELLTDVSFMLLDIDKTTATSQFTDKLVVTGINSAGNVVLASQSFVKNAAYAQFDAKSSTFTGVADVDNSLELGNVTVVFTEAVKEINISYYNLGADRGRQGIGFGNFNGYRTIGALPVELMFFRGAMQSGNAKLSWATAQEVNNDKFVVERSQDGKNYSAIGEVKGNGNSITRINYSFTDTNPAEGINYYRLRQIDFDGAEEMSNIVAVQYKGQQVFQGNLAKVYPTLATDEVNVKLALDAAQITVLDVSGRQVAQYSSTGRELTIPVSQLQRGVYLVKVSGNSQQQTLRFVKQ
ncbi:T9SS type A sorting domain-containing protein [Pontibacter mangrovi]|nr:T9SS type A sorting domain-containing protein [Pontibacter mangrovi]